MECELDVPDYVRGYHRPGMCMAACRQCSRYGRSWTCPPFDYEPLDRISRYGRVRLVACAVSVPPGTPVQDAETILHAPKLRLEQHLLELERQLSGMACTTIGKCPYCGGAECRRMLGDTCLHPDLVRPSLEAYGFDLGRTMTELMGISLKWGSDGLLPDTLHLVGGVFFGF